MVKKYILTINNILRRYNIKNLKKFYKKYKPISKVNNRLIYYSKKETLKQIKELIEIPIERTKPKELKNYYVNFELDKTRNKGTKVQGTIATTQKITIEEAKKILEYYKIKHNIPFWRFINFYEAEEEVLFENELLKTSNISIMRDKDLIIDEDFNLNLLLSKILKNV